MHYVIPVARNNFSAYRKSLIFLQPFKMNDMFCCLSHFIDSWIINF